MRASASFFTDISNRAGRDNGRAKLITETEYFDVSRLRRIWDDTIIPIPIRDLIQKSTRLNINVDRYLYVHAEIRRMSRVGSIKPLLHFYMGPH